MTWSDAIAEALADAGVEMIAYLPDSKMDALISTVEDDDRFETVLVAREEQAVGVLVGAWVGGMRGALLCQSSGLANTFNALGSLSLPARIPFLGVVTRRGNLGEFNIAQVPAGYNMDRLLDDLGVRNTVVTDIAELRDTVTLAGETAFSTQSPYVILLEQTITGHKAEATK
ncbi:thiamine pyrophosphate-binding protein [Halomicrococcus sp. NG-SE-24]|uniref:thiamine pyrophosphate-binding protein n=1 Tax=Halomicrococcus sp. NG-SE-24 TaxID=3436928 RepID=UPI003D98BA48